MVFVTVGNHDQPFDRLLSAMDGLADKLSIDVVMQTGVSDFAPKHSSSNNFYPLEEAEELFSKADIVVGHAGIGTMLSARKFKTPLIVCPRRVSRREHLNDHQLEICEELTSRPRPGFEVALEPEAIEPILSRLLNGGSAGILWGETGLTNNLKETICGFLDSI